MRAPDPTMEGLLRDLADRIRRLELADTLTLGAWVLELAADGSLQARHAPSGTVTVIAVP